MKKTTIVLLLLALIAGLFISCSQEITVDADVHNKINDIDTFCINGKYFSTLQAAVDYFKDSKAMKAPGDNDNVIYLTRNASGPGADIVDIKGLVIDFAGFTYSFTNVTAIQGETGGKFGLSITDGSEVTLKGLEQIDLFDSTADLTMVYIEGSDTSLTIEDAPKMVVEPTQYVFWAANGATLTIGSEDKTKEATITGRVAATGGTTEESKPTITLQGSTKVTGAVEVTKAEVEMIGSSIITGSISTTGSNITVGDESKIKASLTASESSTVTIVSKDNVITNLDKTIDSKIITAEDLVVEEVSGDNKIETTDDATIYKDEQKETESTDVSPVDAQLLAKIGNTLYKTFDDALETVTDSTPTTIVLLGEYEATDNPIVIVSERVITIDLNGWDAGNSGGYISIVNNGYLNIEDTYSSDKDGCGTVYLTETDYSGSGTCIIIGGNYVFNPSAFVPAWCSVTKDSVEDLWTVALITDGVAAIGDLKFATLQSAIDYAVDGDTVKILNDFAISDPVNISKSINLNGDNHTITRSLEASAAGGFALIFTGDENNSLNVVVDKLSVTAINSNGVKFQDYIAKAVVNDCNFNATNRTPAYIGDGDTVNTVYVELNNTNMTMTGSRAGGPWSNTAIGVTNGATAIVTGGTYTGPMAAYIMSSGGKLTINNGSTFISTGSSGYEGDGIRVDRNYWEVKTEDKKKGLDFSDSILTINGGSFGNSHINLWNSGNEGDPDWDDKVLVYIKGGDFENYSIAGVSSPWCLAEITGGTFDADPSAYVAEGYYAKPQGTNPETWTVVPDTPQVSVVKNGESVGQIMSLALFRDKVNAGNTYEGYTITLLVDVDLENVAWTPIGTAEHPFSGTFDGNSKTITGLTVSANGNLGLFGVSQDSELKNFTIDNANISGSGDNSALVSGVAFRTTISGVNVINSTLNMVGGERIGGITGGNYTIIINCSVKNCSITGSEQVGAIAGYICSEPITGCVATDNTIVAKVSRAGGLVGKLDFGDNVEPATVSNNTISGTVTAPDVAGGICGQIMCGTSHVNNYSIANNSMDIECTAEKTSPIGILRSGQPTDFTGTMATKITGNKWTARTYNMNTYTYTAKETGTTVQVIVNAL